MSDFFKWAIQSLQAMVMLGLMGAGFVVIFLVVIPQFIEAFDQRNEVLVLDESINALAVKVDVLSDLDSEDLRSRIGLVLENLPIEADVPFLLSTIKQLARDRGVELRSVGVVVRNFSDMDVGETAVREQYISMNLSGEDLILAKFIEDVERVIPIIKVDKIEIRQGAGVNLEMTLEVVSYSLLAVGDSESDIFTEKLPNFDVENEGLYESLRKRQRFEFVPAILSGDGGRLDPFDL